MVGIVLVNLAAGKSSKPGNTGKAKQKRLSGNSEILREDRLNVNYLTLIKKAGSFRRGDVDACLREQPLPLSTDNEQMMRFICRANIIISTNPYFPLCVISATISAAGPLAFGMRPVTRRK
jgi:hypothetical protein